MTPQAPSPPDVAPPIGRHGLGVSSAGALLFVGPLAIDDDIPVGTIVFVIAALVVLISRSAEKRRQERQRREAEERIEHRREKAVPPPAQPRQEQTAPWYAPAPTPAETAPRPPQPPIVLPPVARPIEAAEAPRSLGTTIDAAPTTGKGKGSKKKRAAKAAVAAVAAPVRTTSARALLFSTPATMRDRVRAAILWSEVLGPPRSARRR